MHILCVCVLVFVTSFSFSFLDHFSCEGTFVCVVYTHFHANLDYYYFFALCFGRTVVWLIQSIYAASEFVYNNILFVHAANGGDYIHRYKFKCISVIGLFLVIIFRYSFICSWIFFLWIFKFNANFRPVTATVVFHSKNYCKWIGSEICRKLWMPRELKGSTNIIQTAAKIPQIQIQYGQYSICDESTSEFCHEAVVRANAFSTCYGIRLFFNHIWWVLVNF